MRRIARWFLSSGTVGIFAAVAVYALGNISLLRQHTIFNPYLMLALAPASILGLAEPTTVGDTMVLLGIVFSTNFVPYGLVGSILCGAWSMFRDRRPASF